MEAHLKLTPEFAAKVKAKMEAEGYAPADVQAVQHKIGDGTLLKIILENLPSILKLFGIGGAAPVAGS